MVPESFPTLLDEGNAEANQGEYSSRLSISAPASGLVALATVTLPLDVAPLRCLIILAWRPGRRTWATGMVSMLSLSREILSKGPRYLCDEGADKGRS
jgi:hypothetical protein